MGVGGVLLYFGARVQPVYFRIVGEKGLRATVGGGEGGGVAQGEWGDGGV